MTGPSPETRALILKRAKLRCERCDRALTSANMHHRRPRRMGGSRQPDTNQPQNLIILCGSGTTGCHGWVETNRHASIADGYLLYAGDDPAERPVLLRDGWHWLLPDGSKSRTKPPVR